jgi:hypothetical protein
MAKQSFVTGQVLTAAQMTSLQQTAMLGGAASAKTNSYTLVAADAGTAISMSNAGATTITVNTALFAAGDTVQITNLGAGICTITAGTATVNTSASLALAQYESGTLDFTSTSAAIFIKGAAAGGGGKVLQVVSGTYSTETTSTSGSDTDTGLSLAITPTLATSKVLVIAMQNFTAGRLANELNPTLKLLRGATVIATQSRFALFDLSATTNFDHGELATFTWLDSPATTSATTYKTQMLINTTANSAYITAQTGSSNSTMILMEIGA